MRKISAQLLYRLYGKSRVAVRRMILRRVIAWEGGEYYSETARRILQDYHGVEIGMYTYGGCFHPGQFPCHTKIGRYCSISRDVLAFSLNHPVAFKSTHAFFFLAEAGYCRKDRVDPVPLAIGHDVWIGAGVKILPGVTEIGTGAVVGANSVLTRNVPPYGVVTGFPARLVRFRFPRGVVQHLLASRWWEQDMDEILPNIVEFTGPYEPVLPGVAQGPDRTADNGQISEWEQACDHSIGDRR